MTNHPNRARELPPLAAALKAYRKRKGLSQSQLAEERGIPVGTLRDMEQPGRCPETHLADLAAWAIDQLDRDA